MAITTLSAPIFNPPPVLGLQAQTPSGDLQRQGFSTRAQVETGIAAIKKYRGRFSKKHTLEMRNHLRCFANNHLDKLEEAQKTLEAQLKSGEYSGEGLY